MGVDANKQVAILSPLDESVPLDLSSYKFYSPRYGSVSVASYLTAHGYRARVFCEHSHNRVDWDYVLSSDYVAFSMMSFCSHRGYEQIARIRARSRAPIILGGNHASALPEDSAAHADFVVRREGEAIILELLRDLDAGGDGRGVPGVTYRAEDGTIVHNPDREFMSDLDVVTDYSLVPGFGRVTWTRRLRDLLATGMPRENLPFIMASRGCPYTCRFCFTHREMGRRLRRRDVDTVIEEIRRVIAITGARTLWFADADLNLHRNFTTQLLTAMAERLPATTDFIAFCRMDVAEDEAMQKLLLAARVRTLCVGAESVKETTLDQFRKNVSPAQLAARVRRLRNAGFRVFASFIFGGEEDVPEDIPRAVDFAVDAGVSGIGLHPLYGFPDGGRQFGGDPIIDDWRFIHHDWRFYSGNFVVFFPRRMRPSQLQLAIQNGHLRFGQKQREAMYEYRPVFLTFKKYIQYLQDVERDLYNDRDELIDERLAERYAASGLAERAPGVIHRIPVEFGNVSTYGYAWSVLARNAVRIGSWKTLFKYAAPFRLGEVTR